MSRPTLQQCQDRLAAFAAQEFPEDWDTTLNDARVGASRLSVLSLMWEGRGAADVPREAHLVFGLDQRLLFVYALDPGMFDHACEEGFDLEMAERMATRRLDGFGDVLRYLRGEAYCLADCA